MSSILTNSQAAIIATAMAVSGTVIFLTLFREKNFPPTQFAGNQNPNSSPQILRSCLSSGGKKTEGRKKKRVRFEESVKDSAGDGAVYRKSMKEIGTWRGCRSEIKGMPANRAALYSGIIRDRVQRMECSY